MVSERDDLTPTPTPAPAGAGAAGGVLRTRDGGASSARLVTQALEAQRQAELRAQQLLHRRRTRKVQQRRGPDPLLVCGVVVGLLIVALIVAAAIKMG